MLAETLHQMATAIDPALLLLDLGLDADPWQAALLRSRSPRTLLVATRQGGKSTAVAALGLHTALYEPGSLVLLVSPSQRQSGLLYRKVAGMWRQLGRPVSAVQESATSLELANGSHVVSLPGSAATVRGFSAPRLILADEAALVDDALFAALLPMLATCPEGRLICLTTPMGKRGFFYDWWESGDATWDRVRVPASACPRIPASFLDEQRAILGPALVPPGVRVQLRGDDRPGVLDREHPRRLRPRPGPPFRSVTHR